MERNGVRILGISVIEYSYKARKTPKKFNGLSNWNNLFRRTHLILGDCLEFRRSLWR